MKAKDYLNRREDRKSFDLNEDEKKKKEVNFLATSRRLRQFSNNKEPKEDDKVVYIDGAFDIFHAGHVKTLEKAKALGSFLLVGIHDDHVINYSSKSNSVLRL